MKIYHPDTSLSIQYKGGEMTAEMKRKRFDMIQEAYDILKNPRRRTAYNRYQTTFMGSTGALFGKWRTME